MFHILDFGEEDLDSKTRSPSSIFNTNAKVIIIDDKTGVIVLHPDVHVSPTRIAESCSCGRKSVLSDRIKSFSGPSLAAVVGKVKHDFIEVFLPYLIHIPDELSFRSFFVLIIGSL